MLVYPILAKKVLCWKVKWKKGKGNSNEKFGENLAMFDKAEKLSIEN